MHLAQPFILVLIQSVWAPPARNSVQASRLRARTLDGGTPSRPCPDYSQGSEAVTYSLDPLTREYGPVKPDINQPGKLYLWAASVTYCHYVGRVYEDVGFGTVVRRWQSYEVERKRPMIVTPRGLSFTVELAIGDETPAFVMPPRPYLLPAAEALTMRKSELSKDLGVCKHRVQAIYKAISFSLPDLYVPLPIV